MTQNIRILCCFFTMGWMVAVGVVSCGEPLPSVTSSCKTNDDCSGSRLCIGSVCVGTGIASVTPTTDASKNQDGGTSDANISPEPVVQCPAQCTQDRECFANGCGNKTQCNQGTCQFPQRCPASCGSNADCSGCTGKTFCVSGQCTATKPECSSDKDCTGQRICQSSRCVDGCRSNSNCRADGEFCRNNKCVRTCQKNDDCKGNQRCRNGVCQ